MVLVEIATTLVGGRRLTDDEVTDLIEAVVDALDGLQLDPGVGTVRAHDDVEFTVSMHVDENEEFDALAYAVGAMKAAFDAAGVGTARLLVPRDVRSQVTLQPA